MFIWLKRFEFNKTYKPFICKYIGGNMLEEKIVSIYNKEYGIELEKEPEFDKIFLPKDIAGLLNSFSFSQAENKFDIYNGSIDKLNDMILNCKKLNNGKKDFTMLFTKNFMHLELFDSLHEIDKWLSPVLKNLAISEYDVGHELVEQNKPYASKFLDRACANLMRYKNNLDKQGFKDSYILSVLAGIYLEMNFDLLKNTQIDITKKIDTLMGKTNLAVGQFYQANYMNEKQNNNKTDKFQGYFAQRFYNFVAHAKHELKKTDKGHGYYKILVNHEHQLFEEIGLPYPQEDKQAIALQ